MSRRRIDGTAALICVYPHKNVLGRQLGGIQIGQGGRLEFCPLVSDSKTFPDFPYGLVKDQGQGERVELNLKATHPVWRNALSHVICLETFGNEGAALLRMSNIAYDALEVRESPATGHIFYGEKEVPVWKLPSILDQKAWSRYLYVTFPDVCSLVQGVGESKAELIQICKIHRDYAYDVSMKAFMGIARSAIINIASGVEKGR